MLSSLFKVREKATEPIIELLSDTVLGTNGAKYRHLDTRERLDELDSPLFLSMERGERVIGNVTFCRRPIGWYVRYFAFAKMFQSSGKKPSSNRGVNKLKQELDDFFTESLTGKSQYGQTDSFYAYIDPNNEKSKWLSESLGFETVGEITTQTFSRVTPKNSNRCIRSTDWEEFKTLFLNQFDRHQHFFVEQLRTGPFYSVRTHEGEIVACAKITPANWEIKRLPGKMGGVLVRLIPFVPVLNKLIKPKEHRFVVPEAVYVKENNPKLLDELFQGILFQERSKLIIWWLDPREKLYSSVASKMKWGILHRLIGKNKVYVVERKPPITSNVSVEGQPFYVSGIDCV